MKTQLAPKSGFVRSSKMPSRTSVEGQSGRFLDVRAKSAYPPKAAVRSDVENGSGVPRADINFAHQHVGSHRHPKLSADWIQTAAHL
jgi:hypothetical protein